MKFRIGTRGSKLAMIQTESVRARLEGAYPEDRFEVVVIATKGDRVTDRPIAAIGDNALFTREIEDALRTGRIDLAVHSMKDLPAECPPGLCLAKAWRREDPRDVLVARDGVSGVRDLPPGATVATGSPRRNLLLRRLRPDLRIVDIRGNVDTRLRKLFAPQTGEPELAAIVLAAAGLKRLGRTEVITEWIEPERMIPAPNQGQLAIELRADDAELRAKVDALGEDADEVAARTERAFLREIGADCHMPVGALARAEGGRVSLRCVFAKDEASPPTFAEATGVTPDEVARRAARAIRRQTAGEVVLVGAGPGDPELITVKGQRAIREADAVLHDRLVSAELLKLTKSGCELIPVGKACGAHTLPQEQINALLAKKALTCRKVVRLKGGDPFVFGRGGEEAAYLAERGVTCRVIPGVTAATAAAAAAGIPVTHRGVAAGFEVVTAHAREGEPTGLDFSRMLDPRRTSVILMGLSRVGEIAASLIAVGRPAATPVAVIGAATLPDQKCVTGTLADIAGKVERAGVVSPAVTVVGDVVSLRDKTGLPFVGKRFLVPEIAGGRNRLPGLLTALGAEVEVLPVGRIVPVEGAVTADALDGVSWIALTSRNGLLPFDGRLLDEVKARGIRIAAIGPATAAAAVERGLRVDWVAAEATGEGMEKGLAAVLTARDVVLHPLAAGAESPLARLADRCAYRPVVAYRNEETPLGRIDLAAYDAAFFTCASSARRVCSVAAGETVAVAIGPATEAALAALGVARVVTAAEPTPEAMAQAAVVL